MSEEDPTPGKDPGYQPRTPLGLQVLAGFGAWTIGIVALIVMVSRDEFQRWPVNGVNATIYFIVALLIVLSSLACWLRLRFRWRGFLPGVLIALAMTCLVPVGIVAVACGWWR
jgi:hypothetical protein